MTRVTILGAGFLALGILALICVPRHLPVDHAAAVSLPSFSATLENNQLILAGVMATDYDRGSLLSRAQEAFKSSRTKITNHVQITDQVSSAGWEPAVPILLGSLMSMQGKSSIDIHNRVITIQGNVSVPEQKTKVLREISMAAGPTYQLDEHIVVMPTPAGATPQPRAAIQSAIDDILRRESIEFESNSATITTRGRTVLDKLVLILQRGPSLFIEIGGHTDPYGDPQYNLQLSHKRAESVRQYLMKHDLQNRFSAIGYGATRPLSSDRSRASLQRNRRIELRVREER